MTNVGNIGSMPLPKVAPRDSAGQGGDAPGDNNAFDSILTRLGKGDASGANADIGDKRDETDENKAVGKALHAAKDRTSQRPAPVSLLAEPPASIAPGLGASANLNAATPVPMPAPGLNLDVPLSVPDEKAAAGDRLPASKAKGDIPQLASPSAQPPSSPVGSDQIAFRLVGTAPIGWRQNENADASSATDKPARGSVGFTSVTVSLIATETHLAPIAAIQPLSTRGLPAKVGESDDAESEEALTISAGDPGTGKVAGAHEKARSVESIRALRSDRASSNSGENAIALRAGSMQQSPVDSSGLPRAALATVADAAVTAANRLQSASPVASPAAAVVAIGEVRIMTVRLDLPEHGGVSLRVSLKGNALSVNLSADRDDTAKRLRRDRDALTTSLRDHGYDTDIGAIDVRRPDAPSSSRDAAGVRDQNSATTGSGSGQPGAEQRPTEPRQQDRGGRGYGETAAPQETRHEKNKPDDNRGSGIYV